MQTPVIQPQQAGLAAASADMNAYAYACRFLLQPPAVQASAVSSPQTFTGGAASAVNWAQPLLDNDQTWAAGLPARFTIMTQGFYEVAAHVPLTSAAVAGVGWIQITSGPSNPAGGGVVLSCWHAAWMNGPSAVASFTTAGIVPQLLYPTDYIQVMIQANTTCTSTTLNSAWPDYSHKLVSI